jgi:hypothetical protein
MPSTGLYLIKSCAYIIAFYTPFILILKHTTFIAINRIYLVSGLLLSFVLPLYTGHTAIPGWAPPDFPFIGPIIIQTGSVISPANEPFGSFTIVALFIIFYLVGIAIRLILLTSSIVRILKLKERGEILAYRNLKVVKTNIPVPFSFFNYVFLPRALDDPGILEHETAHVRQYHWIDLLIVELASIILWFNPVMTVYKRSLKQQHEYLADRSAIKCGIDVGEYLMSIKQQIERTLSFPLVSGFYFQSIKNRINMLTKKRTSAYKLAMYTVVLPIIISLLMAFSPRKHFQFINHGERDSIQEEISLCLPIDKKNSFLLASGYGERRHPVLGVMRLHTGIDLITEEGVPVVAAEEGVVIKAQSENAWGNIVVVQHDDIYSTTYSHLKSINVKEGDKVQKGHVIGLVGHTGLSAKDHLHFELLKNGEAIDPINYLPQIR